MERKTGTTIVGLKYKDGVVLCADTRSTSGPIVADKNCEKIHFIAPKMMCCGAGTAADTGRVTRMASKQMQLFAYKHMRDPFVTHCERLVVDYLHSYGGQIGAALVLGGVDSNGAKLYSISPNGYSASVDFTSLGSGYIAAISVLESEYTRDMSRDEAVALGAKAIRAGILNDLYSGSNVDCCVIDASGAKMMRNYIKVEARRDTTSIVYPKSSIKILGEDIFRYVEEVEE